MKKLLTAAQLAEYLALDPSTIRTWARAGKLPSFRVGSTIRFDPDAVERWLGGQKVGNVSPARPAKPARHPRPRPPRPAALKKVLADRLAEHE